MVAAKAMTAEAMSKNERMSVLPDLSLLNSQGTVSADAFRFPHAPGADHYKWGCFHAVLARRTRRGFRLASTPSISGGLLLRTASEKSGGSLSCCLIAEPLY
jgi:hypothetical protein